MGEFVTGPGQAGSNQAESGGMVRPGGLILPGEEGLGEGGGIGADRALVAIQRGVRDDGAFADIPDKGDADAEILADFDGGTEADVLVIGQQLQFRIGWGGEFNDGAGDQVENFAHGEGAFAQADDDGDLEVAGLGQSGGRLTGVGSGHVRSIGTHT
jgi:hypothetical protein